VFVARQASLQRDVVLKVQSPELADDPEIVERFVQDAQRLARLHHPNILECFEVGQAHGHHFLALDFIEEGSAGTWLKKLGKFSVGDSLYILLSCCAALQHAHELQAVHGDIKPDNVLLAKRAGVKVADIGLLPSHGGDFSLSRSAAGTDSLYYLAPEQLQEGNHPDPRSDLYSLGCLLYVFLTGTAPFKGRTLTELVESKERGTFRPARELNDDVPERLDLILRKLLDVQPEERYASCAALILDLQGLGLASKDLSFLRVAAAPVPAPSSATAPAPTLREWQTRDLEDIAEGYWYVRLKGSDGRSTRLKKATHNQMLALFKKHVINAETPVGRSRHDEFRPLGSYPEFSDLDKAKGKGKTGRLSEQIDLKSLWAQEPPKKGGRERDSGRERGRQRGALRGDPLWTAIRKRWLLWSGAAALLVVAWLFISPPMWFNKLQIAIYQWFN
jgi:serine/threonine-protein kinase